MREIDFQNKAVDFLIDASTSSISKQTIVVKAPTGAGKTIILIKYIDKYLCGFDSKTAFVWLCPGKGDLEEQSRGKMREYFPARKTNDLFDVLTNGFEAGTTTFINWERVTKKGNKAISVGERKNLYERISQAHRDGVSFILVIDEEHLNNTSKARDIIDHFAAMHIIRVSATTVANKDIEYHEIDEQEVIDEGLITKAISVNEDIISGMAQDDSILLELADKKRKQILSLYKKLQKKIRPLVLIQFPNGNPDKIELVEEKLKQMGYSRENKMVAAWLSGDKADVPSGLTENDSQLSFLFIKQAINTGWDCPRAKILVKLREGGEEAFQIQTIGRIRRMPERVHYEVPELDMCYVYTFDEEYKMGLLSGLDKAYIPQRLFLKGKCKDFSLTKEIRDKDGGTVDLRTLYTLIKGYYDKKYKLDNNKKINQSKLAGAMYRFEDELIGTVVSGVFTFTDSLMNADGTIETHTPVNTHVHGMLMRHAMDEFKNILGVQSATMRQIMDRLFSFKYDNKNKILALGMKSYYAFILNNVHLIKEDLRNIAAEVSTQNRLLQPKISSFKIPLEEFYHFDPIAKEIELLESNAYKDYNTAFVTSNCGKSTSEIMFELYCDKRRETIDWIYKNGDSGQQYLSIVYIDGVRAKQKLFYPDYIVKLKNGSTWIIEAKGGQKGSHDNNIDKQVLNKFESFRRYALKYNLQWGFVRNMDQKLYLNNTEYTIDIHDDNWKPLDEVF